MARHACATRADIELSVDGTGLTLRVIDDGCGVREVGRRSGLANVQWRAERRDGSFALGPNSPRGTVLTWHVPNADPAPTAHQPRRSQYDS